MIHFLQAMLLPFGVLFMVWTVEEYSEEHYGLGLVYNFVGAAILAHVGMKVFE